ncbi:MAG: RNA polymerase sigma factor [Thermoguttaceae bacterium]|nr:RNA polymerase sigma factor [Thermoguttaceae bacterium]
MTDLEAKNEQITTWTAQYGGLVRGYLMSMVRRADVADDLSQEVFLRAWKGLDLYAEQGEAKAYLMKIAYRVVCNAKRRRSMEVNVDDETWTAVEPVDAKADPARNVHQTELNATLSAVLDQLSEAEKKVLTLRYFGEMKFNEIADLIEMPLNTVLSHARRGLARMRDIMQKNNTP